MKNKKTKYDATDTESISASWIKISQFGNNMLSNSLTQRSIQLILSETVAQSMSEAVQIVGDEYEVFIWKKAIADGYDPPRQCQRYQITILFD